MMLEFERGWEEAGCVMDVHKRGEMGVRAEEAKQSADSANIWLFCV